VKGSDEWSAVLAANGEALGGGPAVDLALDGEQR
jgi:hypothetical protein